jgi:urea carboxylase
VEFLVDDTSEEFFFLEMNTRIQVEHGVTEAAYGSLDLVELMIRQGICEHEGSFLPDDSEYLQRNKYSQTPIMHSVEARVYAENPSENFRPSPGILQLVDFRLAHENFPEWLRVDTWVSQTSSYYVLKLMALV